VREEELEGAEGRRAGERKASRPRQDTIEVNGGEIQRLNAKKPRLTTAGEDESLACRPMALPKNTSIMDLAGPLTYFWHLPQLIEYNSGIIQ